MWLRTLCVALVLTAAMSWTPRVVLAQEAPKYDVLKQMYDASLGALKAAQDTKNQLAMKNEELTKQVGELQKQLDAATKERDDLRRECGTYAERTFNLRCHYAAWQEFLKRYPTLGARWKVFLDGELLKGANEPPAVLEPDWPFRIEG